jgi:hypothetical protein
MEDRLGQVEQEAKDDVIRRNIDRVVAAYKAIGAVLQDGRVAVTASVDGAWQKRSSGHTYDSPSGHNILIDCVTKLIIGVIVYAKHCGVCDRGGAQQPEPAVPAAVPAEAAGEDLKMDELLDASGKDHRCPKNFKGSSKSMEAIGAVQLVTEAFRTGKIWIEKLVGDDDSTSRAALTPNLELYAEAHPGQPKETYWPQKTIPAPTKADPNRTREVFCDNKGRLKPDVPPPKSFLCDPTHRVRVIGKALFQLAKKAASRVTKTDALRLKRNIGYAHKQARGKSFIEYCAAMLGALLHHGNDHTSCDESWCPYAAGKKDPSENKTSILKGTTKWKNIEEVYNQYQTTDNLKMCHHPYDSQKNESLNQKISMVAPKTKTFSRTKSLEDRVSLVVVLDSVGYTEGFRLILSKLTQRTKVSISTPAAVWLAKKDRRIEWGKAYRNRPETKQKRAQKINNKIKQMIEDDKAARTRGLYYGSGVAIAPEDAEGQTVAPTEGTEATEASKEPPAKKSKFCKHCGGTDHSRITSKKCAKYQCRTQNSNEGPINSSAGNGN